MLHTAFAVAERLRGSGQTVGIIDLFDLTRFSRDRLRDELSRYQTIVSMEEGFAGRGGLDALLYNFIGHNAIDVKLLNIGVEGGYRFELGTRAELHEQVGIGPDVVTRRILDFSKSSPSFKNDQR
jgi:transketolase